MWWFSGNQGRAKKGVPGGWCFGQAFLGGGSSTAFSESDNVHALFQQYCLSRSVAAVRVS